MSTASEAGTSQTRTTRDEVFLPRKRASSLKESATLVFSGQLPSETVHINISVFQVSGSTRAALGSLSSNPLQEPDIHEKHVGEQLDGSGKEHFALLGLGQLPTIHFHAIQQSTMAGRVIRRWQSPCSASQLPQEQFSIARKASKCGSSGAAAANGGCRTSRWGPLCSRGGFRTLTELNGDSHEAEKESAEQTTAVDKSLWSAPPRLTRSTSAAGERNLSGQGPAGVFFCTGEMSRSVVQWL